MRISEGMASNGLRLARVVKGHSSNHALDVIFLDDGSYGCGVKVMSPSASTTSGVVDMPPPTANTESDDDAWSPVQTNPDGSNANMDMLAVVAMVGNMPVSLGYLFPQVNHLAMPEGVHMKIDRHHSDFMAITEPNANYTLKHPGMAAIHMGTGVTPNLEGGDFDQVFKVNKNKELKAQIFIAVDEATIQMSSGVILISAKTSIGITCSGDVTIRGDNIYLN